MTFKEIVHTESLAQSLAPPPWPQALPVGAFHSCAFVPMKHTGFSHNQNTSIYLPLLDFLSYPLGQPSQGLPLLKPYNIICLCHMRYQKSTCLFFSTFCLSPLVVLPIESQRKETCIVQCSLQARSGTGHMPLTSLSPPARRASATQ